MPRLLPLQWTLTPRLALIVVLLLCYLALRSSRALSGLDGWLLELQEQLLATPPASHVAVIEIDEASLAEFGQWPWPRHNHAVLIDWLDAAGATAIGLDIIFAEPSRFGDSDDDALAAAMRRSRRVVLPVAVASAATSSASIGGAGTQPSDGFWLSYPLDKLKNASAALGHASAGIDGSGTLRELQPFLALPGGWLPAFPLALAQHGNRLETHLLTDNHGWLLPGDTSRHLPPRFSFADVINGEVPAQTFAGKHVLVGVSSQGLAPHYPLDASGRGPSQPALLFNAVATAALLDDRILHHVPGWQRHMLAALLVCALALQPMSFLCRGSGRAALALGLTTLLVQQVALRHGHYLPSMDALLLLTLTWLAIRLYRAGHIAGALSRLRGESSAVLDAVADGVLLIDASGRIGFANRRAAELLDRSPRQLRGNTISELGLRGPLGWRAESLYASPPGDARQAPDKTTEKARKKAREKAAPTDSPGTLPIGLLSGLPEDSSDLLQPSNDQHTQSSGRPKVYLYNGASGLRRVLKVSASPVPGRQATVLAMDDVTSLYRLQRKLTHQARHDALTGLPNRTHMQQLIERAIRARRDGGQPTPLAVAFIDFDNFKRINDVLGQSAGDELLVQLSALLRANFGDGYRLARFGSDEFLILCRVTRSKLSAALRRFLHDLQRPLALAGQNIHCQCSIGVSLYPQHGEQADELIRCANLAMHQAKRYSGSHYRFYAPCGLDIERRLEREHDLHQALEYGELEIHYQPRISLTSGRTTGAEALLRWQHPQEGLCMPASFLPAAEELGLMAQISRWVMRCVMNDIRRLCDEHRAPLRLSINLSAQQFMQDGLEAELDSALRDCGAPAGWVEFEITESMLLQDFNRASQVIASLRGRGVTVSLDDFGTGYSALSYLINLPVDAIKIDQSFVSQLRYRKSGDVTRAIVHLARDLGFTTVAEGAESGEQVDFLRTIGCDEVQGYFYSRALPFDDFRNYLAGQH